MRELILDMDSSVSETHGEQEGSAYNGHFGCTCYHPLFCFNQFGDVEQSRCATASITAPRIGGRCWNPWLARYQDRKIPLYFRADAAFANPGLLSIWKPKVLSIPFVYQVMMRCCEGH